MPSSFSQLLNDAVFENDVLSVSITEDWMQGRTTYGGLMAALCYAAAKRTVPDLPPLRSANVSFIGPAGGTVEAHARILRRGKSVSFIEADVHGQDGLATRCVFAFGAGRESIFDQVWTPPPDMPHPEECEDFIPKGLGPNFTNHFETKLAKGARPGTHSKEHDHYIWVRHHDDKATGTAALLALADMPPPAVMPMFPYFKPVSSMTWLMNILTDEPTSADGWWLLQSRAENASRGYSSQDMLVWNSDRQLIITGRQSVVIFL